jgi:hypothetical protein
VEGHALLPIGVVVAQGRDVPGESPDLSG